MIDLDQDDDTLRCWDCGVFDHAPRVSARVPRRGSVCGLLLTYEEEANGHDCGECFARIAREQCDEPLDGCTACGESSASTEDEHGNAVCSACASALAWAASRGIELTPAELRAYGRGWRAEKG